MDIVTVLNSKAIEVSTATFAIALATKEIFKIANIDCKVSPIITQQYPTPAKRPRNTLMNKEKIVRTFSMDTSSWKESLNTYMATLKE